ncbi:hypothetical protein [Pseudoduganella violaceinigra]|uniref:hypothetical protein n=1 Tax=Pseudoduganella violaceinigra TaxID=246602 RepID=UPI000410B365|nr:hypothetical protein [Pseudoduganella violaceinigra]
MNTADKQSHIVTGLFRNRGSAERAWQHASSRGYSRDDINVVMSDDTRQRHFNGAAETELASKAGEGAGIGASVGGALGAALAAVAAMGTTLVLPGLGIVVAGPLAAALAGAGAGGVAGGLVGALIGAGIPEERLKHYEEGIRGGGILMGVQARDAADAADLERAWRDSEGEHVVGVGVGTTGGALAGAAAGSPGGIPGMVAGAVIGGVAGGLVGKGTAEIVNPKLEDDDDDHNLATGVGAGGGAAAGIAAGTLGGPLGMAAGGAIGALAGGLAGQGIGTLLNPSEERVYWQDHYRNEAYFNPNYDYDDYEPAYMLGFTARQRYRGTWDELKDQLERDWETVKGKSRMAWEHARDAVRAAYEREAL